MKAMAKEQTSLKSMSAGQDLRHALSDSPIVGPLITLILLLVLSSIFIPNFFTLRTFSGIINAATVTGIVTIGVTFLMITGEFDLSVGAILAAGAYLYAFTTVEGWSPILAVTLAIVIPAALGAVNGLIQMWTGIHSFIVTLGTRSIYRALVWVAVGGLMVQTQEELMVYDVFNGRLDILNNLFERANFRTSLVWWLLIVILFQILLTRTRFGNQTFATGGNAGAATAQGVNVKIVRVINFALVGALAGFAGVLDFSQFTSVRVATGAGVELTAIAAAVIGGARLEGGSGSIWGALIGVLLISTLRTGVVLLGLPADNFEAIVGVCIIGAVILNNWLRQRF